MLRKEALIVCSNGVIAAWHPKRPFPYQHSRPINFTEVDQEREKLFAPRSTKEKVPRLFPESGPKALDLREIFYTARYDWQPNHYLCLLEHHPVYTVGLREHIYSLAEESRLRKTGADFHRVKRGGLITFHGPGQLVAYPIFNLRTLPKTTPSSSSIGARNFVHNIEQTVISLLTDDFRIDGVGRTVDTGVWVKKHKKIAAIGIQVSSAITSHGLALNCNTDLTWFQHIVPCGLEGKLCTSISQEVGRNVAIDDVLELFCNKFRETFNLPATLIHLCVKDDSLIDEFLNSDRFLCHF